ncbi:hypothetical protein [Glycomyces artemisiae]|uniref:Peptidase inhibitor family I36 n=1 Tax=Glycomyces artemisiae TaxID=1076443 RepID=A0A2T0UXB3_9ACTN|nr:hypothetical protein [Glycomyces artemisiae]PRY62488.1 hypothetical protein B0I28_101822 [Glycomyces artemisiae]
MNELVQRLRRRTGRLVLALVASLVMAALVAVPQGAASEPAPPASPDVAAADVFDPDPWLGGSRVPGSNVYEGARGVYAPSYLPSCEWRYVCVAVLEYQDDHVNKWRVWKIYICGSYYLYEWRGRGWVNNNQTGGAALARFDQDNVWLSPNANPGGGWKDINWEPAYWFDSCI